jgi:hypothetical protein
VQFSVSYLTAYLAISISPKLVMHILFFLLAQVLESLLLALHALDCVSKDNSQVDASEKQAWSDGGESESGLLAHQIGPVGAPATCSGLRTSVAETLGGDLRHLSALLDCLGELPPGSKGVRLCSLCSVFVFDVEDMSNFAKTMSNFERPFLEFWRALCQRLASARRF